MRGVVEIADARPFVEMIAPHRANASSKGWAAPENRRAPLRKTAERFGDGARFRAAGVKNGVQIGVIQAASALRRDIESAARLMRAGLSHPGKDAVKFRHAVQAYAPCAIPSIARITRDAPSAARTSMGRAPPSSGSEPPSHKEAASREYTRRILVKTS